jgi:hypothetical protein
MSDWAREKSFEQHRRLGETELHPDVLGVLLERLLESLQRTARIAHLEREGT